MTLANESFNTINLMNFDFIAEIRIIFKKINYKITVYFFKNIST